MKMKKASILFLVFLLIVFSTLAVPLLISGNASAHAPTAIYPTYKEGSLTVYIDHASDDPSTHYIKTVTVSVNRVEVLSETYTSQTADDAKGMVTYSYTVAASDGDYISVTAECSIDGSVTGSLTVGDDSKDDGKDDPNKDYPDKDYPSKDDPRKDDPAKDDPNQDGDSDQENNTTLLLSGAIVGMVVIIIALVAVLRDWNKGKARKGTTQKGAIKKDKIKKDDWTTCPECGSSLKMGKLHSHLDKVHPEMSKGAKEKMIDQVIKRVQTQ